MLSSESEMLVKDFLHQNDEEVVVDQKARLTNILTFITKECQRINDEAHPNQTHWVVVSDDMAERLRHQWKRERRFKRMVRKIERNCEKMKQRRNK